MRFAGARRSACADPVAPSLAHGLHRRVGMPYQLVTCPDSAHIELIEYAETPCGMLILGCTSFQPPCSVDCPRTCAARLDQRERVLGRVDAGDLAPDDERLLAIGDITSVDVLARLLNKQGA